MHLPSSSRPGSPPARSPQAPSLSATRLRKHYGSVHALDDFDLTIPAGRIHGLLGPNGAGKSTAVRALATLIDLDSGEATVAGYDVRSQSTGVRASIGLVGQSPAVDEILGGRQNLVMFGRLFGLGKRSAGVRADELLAAFDLTEAATRPVSGYSGGMRRRLDIAASLILSPAVLFLDEPTTGLDPRGRNEVWRTIRRIARAGTTVLLTTQHLDEADQLADTISVMNAGHVIRSGTPDELKKQLGADRIVVTVADAADLASAADAMRSGGNPTVDEAARTVTAEAPSGTAALMATVRALDTAGIQPIDLVLRRPTLDEVFLALTAQEDPS
ncbi:ATP-binding cassette domain-containing protein [Mycetocola zhujimingii]|uniref:ATP-binding cassette domain-containing protein n=1 Tax=Mycetocola zhujimingii TaxID=2079792 RepID=UPI000D38E3EB|nr:ATP-binding cassette domain-containing protein [Mycetocola zhujimingii]AWB87314.1 daunorubicin/doxorubicin resistance ABC transporter ATP-binding protein DrrA [Mycetocola zhujimingii]